MTQEQGIRVKERFADFDSLRRYLDFVAIDAFVREALKGAPFPPQSVDEWLAKSAQVLEESKRRHE